MMKARELLEAGNNQRKKRQMRPPVRQAPVVQVDAEGPDYDIELCSIAIERMFAKLGMPYILHLKHAFVENGVKFYNGDFLIRFDNMAADVNHMVKAFKTDGMSARAYAFAIQRRWPEGEPAIAADSQASYYYAAEVLYGRFPAGEEVIATDPHFAFAYAKHFIQGPWPPGEAAILTNPPLVLDYTTEIIKGRWPPGEAVIAADPWASFTYATRILKDRFPAGEAAIAANPDVARFYAHTFFNDRWPEAGIP